MIRVAIFSDIHFGKFSRTQDFSVPGEPIQDRSEDATSLEKELRQLLNIMHPHYFFIAGDLTSIGEPQEFVFCEKKIISLAESVGICHENILCGLGNHDIDWNISELAIQKIHDKMQEDVQDIIKKKYQEMAANSAVLSFDILAQPMEKGPAPFSGMFLREDFVVFVLNTGWFCTKDQSFSHGKLSKEQLSWFDETCKKYKDDTRIKIVLMHHHPLNYSYPVPISDISTIEEGAEIMDIVYKNRINIVIHGHRHHPRVETVQKGSGTLPVTLICAGSLSVNAEHRNNGDIPNTIHFLDIDSTKDYFILHNYQYTGPEGWKPIAYNEKITPLDHKMYVGKVFSEENIKEAVLKYKEVKVYKTLKWEDLDECLHFMTSNKVNELFKELLGEIFIITGDFPKEVSIFRKEEDNGILK